DIVNSIDTVDFFYIVIDVGFVFTYFVSELKDKRHHFIIFPVFLEEYAGLFAWLFIRQLDIPFFSGKLSQVGGDEESDGSEQYHQHCHRPLEFKNVLPFDCPQVCISRLSMLQCTACLSRLLTDCQDPTGSSPECSPEILREGFLHPRS